MSIRSMLAFCAVALLAPTSLKAAQVVGFPDTPPEPYMAVRWRAEQNSTIYGVCFYSNDVTVFPEVALATDYGSVRVPAVKETLRTATSVSALSGYTTVTFDPYAVTENDPYLWIVLRFPGGGTIIGDGVGGGPGIGWLERGHLVEQRSFFGSDSSINEFRGAFDVSLVTALPPAGKQAAAAEEKPSAANGATQHSLALSLLRSAGNGETGIQFMVDRNGTVDVSIFNVLGQRVCRLVRGSFVPGIYSREWTGYDDHGRRVANGVYVVALSAHGVLVRQKLVLIH